MSKDTHVSVGGRLESFFEELGERDEVYGEALKRVLAWGIEDARKKQGLTKSAMASRIGTSRTQVERVLDPENVTVSLETLDKAARAVGLKLRIELVAA